MLLIFPLHSYHVNYLLPHAPMLCRAAGKHRPPNRPSREELVYPGYIVTAITNRDHASNATGKHHAKHIQPASGTQIRSLCVRQTQPTSSLLLQDIFAWKTHTWIETPPLRENEKRAQLCCRRWKPEVHRGNLKVFCMRP
jgi:hypothetical protein